MLNVNLKTLLNEPFRALPPNSVLVRFKRYGAWYVNPQNWNQLMIQKYAKQVNNLRASNLGEDKC